MIAWFASNLRFSDRVESGDVTDEMMKPPEARNSARTDQCHGQDRGDFADVASTLLHGFGTHKARGEFLAASGSSNLGMLKDDRKPLADFSHAWIFFPQISAEFGPGPHWFWRSTFASMFSPLLGDLKKQFQLICWIDNLRNLRSPCTITWRQPQKKARMVNSPNMMPNLRRIVTSHGFSWSFSWMSPCDFRWHFFLGGAAKLPGQLLGGWGLQEESAGLALCARDPRWLPLSTQTSDPSVGVEFSGHGSTLW